jgi:hypothetical protein
MLEGKIKPIRTRSVDRIGDRTERPPPETLSRPVEGLDEIIR